MIVIAIVAAVAAGQVHADSNGLDQSLMALVDCAVPAPAGTPTAAEVAAALAAREVQLRRSYYGAELNALVAEHKLGEFLANPPEKGAGDLEEALQGQLATAKKAVAKAFQEWQDGRKAAGLSTWRRPGWYGRTF